MWSTFASRCQTTISYRSSNAWQLSQSFSSTGLKKTVRHLTRPELAQKRVFVRADLNVPLNAAGEITDDTRVRAALPTLAYLVSQEAKIVLASHLGRPKGRVSAAYSLAPVAKRLQELLPEALAIHVASDCLGLAVESAKKELAAGEVLLLENLRFHPQEEANDADFSAALGKDIDVYVNDAFGTAHRAHASTAGITSSVPTCVAGDCMTAELAFLAAAIKSDPVRPLAALVGGAKISSKLPVLESLLTNVDKLLVGGGMIFTFYKAMGYKVGDSIVELEQVMLAKELMAKAAALDIPLILPTDVVIADAFDVNANTRIVAAHAIPDGWRGLDIGPESIQSFTDALAPCKTILWNGPMGVFELAPFAAGTMAMAHCLAQCTQQQGAITVIGGGDSVAAVSQAQLTSAMSHISTGGGASLELLEGKTLPGVQALDDLS